MSSVRPEMQPPVPTPRVLVTGASGFVGRGLFGGARADQDRWIPVVRRPSGLSREIVIGDRAASPDWLTEGMGDVIVHLAARVHRMSEDPRTALADHIQANVEPTLALARRAADCGVRRFVFVSTVKVIGEGGPEPVSERTPAEPHGPYALSKRMAEQGLEALAETSGLEVVILRPTLIYGPGARGNLLGLMQALYKGRVLPLGAIHNRRSLTGLQNFCDLIDICVSHPAAANRCFLAADSDVLSTTGLVRELAHALHASPHLLPIPGKWLGAALRMFGKEALAQRLCGDFVVENACARQLLGWRPNTPVAIELGRMADAFLRSRGSS